MPHASPLSLPYSPRQENSFAPSPQQQVESSFSVLHRNYISEVRSPPPPPLLISSLLSWTLLTDLYATAAQLAQAIGEGRSIDQSIRSWVKDSGLPSSLRDRRSRVVCASRLVPSRPSLMMVVCAYPTDSMASQARAPFSVLCTCQQNWGCQQGSSWGPTGILNIHDFGHETPFVVAMRAGPGDPPP